MSKADKELLEECKEILRDAKPGSREFMLKVAHELSTQAPKTNKLVKLEELDGQPLTLMSDIEDEGRIGGFLPALMDDLLLHVTMGRYPPPELLMALAYRWSEYLENKMSLDEAFGEPRGPGKRDIRTRRTTWKRHVFAIITYQSLLDSGANKTNAIQKAAEKHYMTPDALRKVIDQLDRGEVE